MGNFTKWQPRGQQTRSVNCNVGDFGVHLYDRSAKLEVVSFDGPLVMVRFSATGTPRPMIREELYFDWDKPKPREEERKPKRERFQDDEDDD